MLNIKINIELLEGLVVKLLTIIGDECVWESELASDGFLEVLDLGLGDVCQGFDFHPFGGIINGD